MVQIGGTRGSLAARAPFGDRAQDYSRPKPPVPPEHLQIGRQRPKGTMHNVTVCRSYRGRADWKNAYSFGPADLRYEGTVSPLAKALNGAHSWIHEQMAAARNSSRGDEGRRTGTKH